MKTFLLWVTLKQKRQKRFFQVILMGPRFIRIIFTDRLLNDDGCIDITWLGPAL